MLNGQSGQDKKFQDVIRKELPKKENFSTAYGQKPFSKYESLAPYELSNPVDAGVVGTAFDYLGRVMIAQMLEKNKEYAVLELKALLGLERIEKKISKYDFKLLQDKYINVLVDFIDFVYSNYSSIPNAIIEKCKQEEWNAWVKYMDRCRYSSYKPLVDVENLIQGAYYFAKLEQVYRTGGMLPEDGIRSLISNPSDEVVKDISNLCKVFKERFIKGGLVQSDSVVIFNPSFGIASYACGGADADVYIDGVLYDFKTSKNVGYSWQETAQLVMYYYLNEIASFVVDSKLPAKLSGYPIDRLAFYKARYGEIEYIDTDYFESQAAEENFNEISDLLLQRLNNRML